MALLWLEGFDWIDSGTTGTALENVLLRRYETCDVDYSTDAVIETGRGGVGKSLKFAETNHYLRTPQLQTEQLGNTWIMGAAIKFDHYPLDNNTLFRIDDSTLNASFNVYIIENYIRVNGQSTLGYAYDIFNQKDEWYYVECKVKVDNSPNGSFEIKVNGTTVLSQTGVDTAYRSTTGSDRVVLRGICNGPTRYMWMDDIYVCDDSGTLNNDFLGPIVVRNISPDADGDDAQWTLSSGASGYPLVNETSPADDDSDYIEDTTTGNRSIFTMSNVPSGQTGIVGVQQWTDCRITDATNYTLKQTIKQNGTLYPSTGKTISNQSFAQYYDILETDPDTGVAWTESGLNAIQSGVEVG